MSENQKSSGKRSFFRGEHTNLMPRAKQMREISAIVEHILSGWMPKQRFINKDSNIVAFGSCFAANIGRYLDNLGFDIATERKGRAYVQKVSDGLVNVFAITQQFEWAWENRQPDVHLWHGWKAEDYGYDEEVRLETKRLFDEADAFILTFGLSEVWYDEPTGEVFWRAVPADKYDPARHKFRVATHAETVERLQRIYALIRKHRPQAAIVFTLSPVGLAATFRPVSCITANSVSKAKLRSAIDEVHTAANDSNFYYFPSYEVVTEGFETAFTEDRRHPQIYSIEANMKAFEYFFCETDLSEDEFKHSIEAALKSDQMFTRGDLTKAIGLMKETKERLVAGRRGASSAEIEVKRHRREALRAEKIAAQSTRIEARERQMKEAKEHLVAGRRGAFSAEIEVKRHKREALRAENIAARSARIEARERQKKKKETSGQLVP